MIQIQARALALALAAVVKGIVAKRNTIPILSNVRLTLDNDGLTLTTTDLDMQARLTLDVEGQGAPFDVTVPADTLLTMAKKAPSESMIGLAPEQDGPRFTFCAGRQESHLPMLPADDMPVLQGPDGEAGSVGVPSGAWRAHLKAVSPAMSKEATRYYLNGAFLHMRDEGARLVACDGNTLAVRDLDALVEGDVPSVIIPRAAVAWLAKNTPDDGMALLTVSRDRLELRAGELTFTTKTVDGAYPDYERLLDDEATAFRCYAGHLAASLELAMIAAPMGKRRSITATLEGGELTLTAKSIGEGLEAACGVEGEAVGDDVVLLFPANQLLANLKPFDRTEAVELRHTGRTVVVRSLDNPDRVAVVALETTERAAAAVVERVPLERPVVHLSMPRAATLDYCEAGPTEIVVTAQRYQGEEAEPRVCIFPTRAAAARAWIRLRAALEATCDLHVGRDAYIPNADPLGRDIAAELARPVTMLDHNRVRAMRARAYAMQAAVDTFTDTTEASVPWPRRIVDRCPAPSLFDVPATACTGHTAKHKPTRDLAFKLVREAQGLAPPPKVEEPLDPHQVFCVASWLRWTFDKEATSADAEAFMGIIKVRTERGLRKRSWKGLGPLRDKWEAYVAKRDAEPEAVEPEAPSERARVRIWATDDGRWGYEGGPFQFGGLDTREGAVRHAIAAHPDARVVLTAGGPPSNVVPLRPRIPAHLAGPSAYAMTAAG